VGLPDVDGYTLCQTLRVGEKTATLPILIMSARSGLDEEARALEAKADHFLAKPVRAKALSTAVQLVIDKRKADS
jgi:DNA-binding response OmpR family regulator